MKRIGYLDAQRLRVGNVPNWDKVPALLTPGTMEAFGIYEQFTRYLLADNAVPTVPGWTNDTPTNTVLSIPNVVGGGVLLTAAAALDNNQGQIFRGDGVGGAFWPEMTKDIWYEARVKQTIAGTNQLNLAFGLVNPCLGTEILDDDGVGWNAGANNHLAFYTLDTGAGANAWSFSGDKGGVTDNNALGVDLVSDVFHYYGFHVYGTDPTGLLPMQCDVYYDRAIVAAGQVLAASIPVTGLTPFLCIKTGSVAEESVTMQYNMCVQLR